MANYYAKGKGLKYREKAQQVSFRLYSWEKEPVREYIKRLRQVHDIIKK